MLSTIRRSVKRIPLPIINPNTDSNVFVSDDKKKYTVETIYTCFNKQLFGKIIKEYNEWPNYAFTNEKLEVELTGIKGSDKCQFINKIISASDK